MAKALTPAETSLHAIRSEITLLRIAIKGLVQRVTALEKNAERKPR